MNSVKGSTSSFEVDATGLYTHREKSLLTFFGFCFLAVLVALFFPRSDFSEAKLFVRFGREFITLDPTATSGETVTMQKSQEAEIKSVLDILESRQIKETVVAAVGADEILETNRQHVLFSAIGSARSAVSAWLFAEYLDNSLRAPDQIESQLGISVVTTIPRDTRGKSSEKVLRFFKSQAC